MKKSCRSQNIILAVEELYNECAYSWKGFAEGILQIVLFAILC